VTEIGVSVTVKNDSSRSVAPNRGMAMQPGGAPGPLLSHAVRLLMMQASSASSSRDLGDIYFQTSSGVAMLQVSQGLSEALARCAAR
jgi:hypothetical protein